MALRSTNPGNTLQQGTVPTLYALHFLGGSAREWAAVTARLAGTMRVVGIDLPGFGDAAGKFGFSVGEMADHVADAIKADAQPHWMLAGHSMGAKVAMAVARRSEDGEAGLAGLMRLVLLAGSPPSPEPMEDDQRATMLSWFSGDVSAQRREAEGYVDQNAAAALPAEARAAAIDDVLRGGRDAWRAWLETGSREDWAARIGVLRTPALILAGEQDEALGLTAQRDLSAPHFVHARLVELPGAKHLLPIEAPDAVAALIVEHAALSPDYRAFIDSERVSANTRDALLDRLFPEPDNATALAPAERATLRAVASRIIPQSVPMPIDLAGMVDSQLAKGDGDGWRFAALPADREAYSAGLRTLEAMAQAGSGKPFVALDPQAQDAILQRCGDGGDITVTAPGLLDSTQVKLWFEEVRSDLVKAYVAHPATLARLGYSGIANGGDGVRKIPQRLVGVGEEEGWEPQPEVVS